MRTRYATFDVAVPTPREDEACGLLFELETLGIEVAEAVGGVVTLTASFAARAGLEEDVRGALAPLDAVVTAVERPEVDWVARFREEFRAFEAGGFLVVPAWDARAADERTIVVDPGRAFGTGTHETTRLCLTLLGEEAGRRPLGGVIDVGAGTGILAIGSLRLGARTAVAADLDPEATASSSLHARLNRVPLHVVEADGAAPFRAGAFDVLLANLMAPLLIERAGELRAACAAGGTLILSGLLADDVREVSRAYAFGAIEPRLDGEWAAIRIRLA